MLPRALRLAGRFPRLYKLLWADERLTALEELFARMQQAMEYQRNGLENQRSALNAQRASLENQAAILRGQSELNLEQLDMLKSSLDVPRELVEEFFGWKARNPVPERPLVSVAVATYNRAEVLTRRCIPSVLGQTYENLELIVVGDHCTDGTEEAVSRIDDPRLKFVNLPEKSVYPEDPRRRWMVAGTPPTNEAFSMARGDYITQLDDDDEYLPERLEKLVAFAGRERVRLRMAPLLGRGGRRRAAGKGREFLLRAGDERVGLLPVLVQEDRGGHRVSPADGAGRLEQVSQDQVHKPGLHALSRAAAPVPQVERGTRWIT